MMVNIVIKMLSVYLFSNDHNGCQYITNMYEDLRFKHWLDLSAEAFFVFLRCMINKYYRSNTIGIDLKSVAFISICCRSDSKFLLTECTGST